MRKFIGFFILFMLICGVANAQTWYSWRYRTHATDCTALTDGKTSDLCFEADSATMYKCVPDAGDCSGTEWKAVEDVVDTDTDDQTCAEVSGCVVGAITAVASDSTWTTHNSYPSACTAGQYVSAIGDTLTCGTPTDTNTTYTATDFDIKDLTDSTSLRSTWSAKLGSGGTLTTNQVCQYDGSGIDCNLTKDSSGDCASGAVCLGDHTHSSYAPLVSPSFTTPTLGVASATSINKVAITAPANGSTLTIADGKTLTATNTVNLNTMTDGKWCKYSTAGTALDCNVDPVVDTDDQTCAEVSGCVVGAITSVASDSTWTTHNSYPSACSSGEYVSAIGDTLTCSTPTGAAHDAVTLAGRDYLTLATQQITAGYINGDDINWATIDQLVQSSNVNWANIEVLAPINSAGVNWTDLEAMAPINSGAVNWDSLVVSDTQVIFLDGTTPAGDEGLTYNKTTNTLTVGSLVTQASGQTTITQGLVVNSGKGSTADDDFVVHGDTVDNIIQIDSSANSMLGLGFWDLGMATSFEIPNSASLPATCVVGQIYMDADATSGQRLYLCESANTWVLQGDGTAEGGEIGADTVQASNVNWDDMTDLGEGGTVVWANLAEGELPDSSVVKADINWLSIDNIEDEHVNWLAFPTYTDDYYLRATGTGVAFEAVAGTGGGNFFWVLQPQQAKLPASNPMAIDAGNARWRGLFDDTTAESATWEGVLQPFPSGTLKAKVFYSMASATSGTVEFEIAVDCFSDGDAADFDTASFGTVDSVTATVPATAGYIDVLADTSLNGDSCAEGDLIVVQIARDSDDGTNDTATGDAELRKVIIYAE